MAFSIKRHYNLHNHQKTVHVIPTLDELLQDDNSYGYYSKLNFIEYLQSIHCLENLSFVLAINNYFLSPSIWKWKIIYEEFLQNNSVNEINLPGNLKANVSSSTMPDVNLLKKFKRIIYDDILLDLYNEFIKIQKSKMASINPNVVYRRKSETLSPEILKSSANFNQPPQPGNEPVNCNIQQGGDFCPIKSKKLTHQDIDDWSSYISHRPPSSCPKVFDDDNETVETELFSRNNSTGSSRGSSIGSFVDGIKNNNLVNKFKFRRFSDKHELG
jgi:hypothetical protein